MLDAAVNALTGFANLPEGVLGTTAGGHNAITLDADASGHGWYIDATPADHSEFLPTADPTVWLAKDGSAAAGKMDMLSVLLHEYGHALGLEHSGDGHNFMAATLKPGERRLPSGDELQRMAQLVAELKAGGSQGPGEPSSPAPYVAGLGLLALVRPRNGRYGTWEGGVRSCI